jgi:hypothetical protein
MFDSAGIGGSWSCTFRSLLASLLLGLFGKCIFMLAAGDELLSDSFDLEETHNGIFYKVPGKVSYLPLGYTLLETCIC